MMKMDFRPVKEGAIPVLLFLFVMLILSVSQGGGASDTGWQQGALDHSTSADAAVTGSAVGIGDAPRDGCDLRINDVSYRLPESAADCESIFIALKYNTRVDFYRLLSALGYVIDESLILDSGNQLSVAYKNARGYEDYSYLDRIFTSDKCEDINFFGIGLSCFNAIEGNRSKASNLEYIIPIFTLLRYTSDMDHENLLKNITINAYDFIIQSRMVYYDGTDPSFYGKTLSSIYCLEGKGLASYHGGFMNKTAYVCESLIDKENFDRKKISYAGVMYHEANHKYSGAHAYAHEEDKGRHVEEVAELEITSDCFRDKRGRGVRDRDFNSVYGAHINYLLSISQNEILSCEERHIAFEEAKFEMKTKLCQDSGWHEQDFPAPTC